MNRAKKIRITFSDDEICQRVRKFLGSRHFPSFRRLGVAVKHGSVTISGQVCSFYEKQVAITSCQHVAGVLSLIDRIEVSDREFSRTSSRSQIAIAND